MLATSVSGASKLRWKVACARIGENLPLDVMRNGRKVRLDVKPRVMPAQSQAKERNLDELGFAAGNPDSQSAVVAGTSMGATVVALAPGGSSNPKPGMLRAELAFAWGRDVPTLYLVAENDVSLPLAGMYELFDRTPATKRMVVLRRADHLHFMDDVEEIHEAVRAIPWPGELAWLPKEMRPIEELCSGEQAHLFARGLAVCHMDAVLKHRQEAQRRHPEG